MKSFTILAITAAMACVASAAEHKHHHKDSHREVGEYEDPEVIKHEDRKHKHHHKGYEQGSQLGRGPLPNIRGGEQSEAENHYEDLQWKHWRDAQSGNVNPGGPIFSMVPGVQVETNPPVILVTTTTITYTKPYIAAITPPAAPAIYYPGMVDPDLANGYYGGRDKYHGGKDKYYGDKKHGKKHGKKGDKKYGGHRDSYEVHEYKESGSKKEFNALRGGRNNFRVNGNRTGSKLAEEEVEEEHEELEEEGETEDIHAQSLGSSSSSSSSDSSSSGEANAVGAADVELEAIEVSELAGDMAAAQASASNSAPIASAVSSIIAKTSSIASRVSSAVSSASASASSSATGAAHASAADSVRVGGTFVAAAAGIAAYLLL